MAENAWCQQWRSFFCLVGQKSKTLAIVFISIKCFLSRGMMSNVQYIFKSVSTSPTKKRAGEEVAEATEGVAPPQKSCRSRGQLRGAKISVSTRQTSPSRGSKGAAIIFCHLPVSFPKEKSVALQLSQNHRTTECLRLAGPSGSLWPNPYS